MDVWFLTSALDPARDVDMQFAFFPSRSREQYIAQTHPVRCLSRLKFQKNVGISLENYDVLGLITFQKKIYPHVLNVEVALWNLGSRNCKILSICLIRFKCLG